MNTNRMNDIRISRALDGLNIDLQFNTDIITFADIEKAIREVASIAAAAYEASPSDETEEPEETKPAKKTTTRKATSKRTTAKAKKVEEPEESEDEAEDTLELRKQVANACKTLIGFGNAGKTRFKKIDSEYLPDGGKLSDLDELTLKQMMNDVSQAIDEMREAAREIAMKKSAARKATSKKATAKTKKVEEPEESEDDATSDEEAEEDDPVTRKELRELAKEIAASGVKGRKAVKDVLGKYTKVGKLVAVPDDKITDMYNDLCDVYDEIFPEDKDTE